MSAPLVSDEVMAQAVEAAAQAIFAVAKAYVAEDGADILARAAVKVALPVLADALTRPRAGADDPEFVRDIAAKLAQRTDHAERRAAARATRSWVRVDARDMRILLAAVRGVSS